MLTARCCLDTDAVRVRIALTVKWPSSLVPTAESGSVQRSTLCAEVRKELFFFGGGAIKKDTRNKSNTKLLVSTGVSAQWKGQTVLG
jgi:hypothetical protein